VPKPIRQISEARSGKIKSRRSKTSATWGQNLNRSNIVYLIVGALVIVVAVLGYELYQDRKQPEGVRIDVGPKGLSIEKK
jgi:hypothetical protein